MATLSKQEQDDLWARVQEVNKQAGAVWHIVCDSRWADESVFDWGVIEYPDFDTYRQKVAELEKLNWWRYWSCKTILGTKMEQRSDTMGCAAETGPERFRYHLRRPDADEEQLIKETATYTVSRTLPTEGLVVG